MTLKALECTQCGAAVRGSVSTQFLKCEFCGLTLVNTAYTPPAVPTAPVAPVAQAPVSAAPQGPHPPGTHVWALWSGGGSGFRFYPAVVSAFDGARYHVVWDDGDEPTWEHASRVLVPTPASANNTAPGMRVAAQWTNGAYYSAVLQQFDGRRFLVAWEDGTAPSWVDGSMVFVGLARAAPVPTHGGFPVGAHVQAKWTNGSYYGGTVMSFDGARYYVRWDDGDTPLWVAAHEVRAG